MEQIDKRLIRALIRAAMHNSTPDADRATGSPAAIANALEGMSAAFEQLSDHTALLAEWARDITGPPPR